jgi:2'-5' RNA ligase
MRLFYASFLNSSNMRAYESMVARISAVGPRVIRPIPAATHHLTMAFLGEIEESDLTLCLEALEAVADSETFDYSLAQPRILYTRRVPRLICADIAEGAEKVAYLQAQLRDAFLERFPQLELRAQSPHITLARFKRHAHPKTARQVSEALAALQTTELPQRDHLESIQLVKSNLTSSGPVYESLGKATLKSPS